MWNLLLLGLLAYIIYKGLRKLGAHPQTKDSVQGDAQTKPLDLRDANVQDARFKDIDEKR
ncbi:MAG TPA: hypothetical protein VGB38_00125 [bacterium]